jgi:formylglycine-generating enzyme required for sulfatase activity
MPIVGATWDNARAYCGWAGGRLPTEAEWEYAARAGSTEARYGPTDEVAWYAENSGVQRLDSTRMLNEVGLNDYYQRLVRNGNGMHDAGLKRPNGFGLFDTLGNVWEWVRDWYDQNYYQNSPSQDPSGPPGGQYRVIRGGSWFDTPSTMRVSLRNMVQPGDNASPIGFRCAGEVVGP